MRRNLPSNIDSLSECGSAPNGEASLSSWKHPEELPFLDDDPSHDPNALSGGQGFLVDRQFELDDEFAIPSDAKSSTDINIHDVELNKRLDRMVFNARVSGVEKTLQLPWESECFSGIFAARDSVFPQVDSELVCFENPSQSIHCSIPGPADEYLKLDHVQNCFEGAISFRAGRTKSMQLEAHDVKMPYAYTPYAYMPYA